MIELTINGIVTVAVPIVIGVAGVVYGLVKRIELKEVVSVIKTIREVTQPASEGGKKVTVDEKLQIADKVIEILKK